MIRRRGQPLYGTEPLRLENLIKDLRKVHCEKQQKLLIPGGVDLAFTNFPEFFEAREALIIDRLKKNCKDNCEMKSRPSAEDRVKILLERGLVIVV